VRPARCLKSQPRSSTEQPSPARQVVSITSMMAIAIVMEQRSDAGVIAGHLDAVVIVLVLDDISGASDNLA
jgi:hypothetical protein